MTIKEFIDNKNRFGEFEINTTLSVKDLVEISKGTALILFNTENGNFRPLFRRFGIRLTILRHIFGIDLGTDYDLEDVFGVIMSRDFMDRFNNEVVPKLDYDYNELCATINEYIDDELYKVRKGIKDINTQVIDTLYTLFSNEAFIEMLNKIPIEALEENEDTKE